MDEDPKIIEQEVRDKEGNVVGHVTYDGESAKVDGTVKAQHIEGAQIAWAEKYRTKLELIEETGAKCTMCGGEQELFRHIFMNDNERRKEIYRVIKCKLCGNSVAVHGSAVNIPYK